MTEPDQSAPRRAGTGTTVAVIAVLAVAAVLAALYLDRRGTPEPVEVTPTEGSAAFVPTAVLEPAGRMALGRTLTAVAFDGRRVAAFTSDGRLVVAPVPLPAGDPPEAVPAGAAVDAVWTPRGLVAAEAGDPPSLALWPPDGSGEPRRQPLDMRPVDIARVGDSLRVLARSPVDGLIVDLAEADPADGAAFHETTRHTIGRSPVGLFDAGGAHLVPIYGERTVVRVDGDGATAIAVDFRPVAAVPLGDVVVATAANAPTAAVFDPRTDVVVTRELPAPWTVVAPLDGAVVAFAASVATLYRVTGPELAPSAEQGAFDLVTAIVPTTDGNLLVADAGDQPRLALIDGVSLDVLAEVPVEGRPAWVSAVGDMVVVSSPAEGVVSAWRIVRPMQAAP